MWPIACVLSTLAVLSTASFNDSRTCIIPVKPIHGSYITDQSENVPGSAVQSIRVYYKCDEGYEALGPLSVSCEGGEWTEFPHVPECIPICDVEKNFVTCGAEDKICSIPKSYNKENYVRTDNRFGTEKPRCGEPIDTSYVIAGGDGIVISETPWHSGIYRKTTSPYMQICGGTLVSKDVVISAAHCFWSEVSKLLPASNFAVAVGKQYRPWANPRDHGQQSDVKDIKIPPRFRGGVTNFQDDIALVTLTSPVTFNVYVQPACLSFDEELETRQLQPGNMGKVAGWGLTSTDGKASPVLQTATLTYVNIQRCITEVPPGFEPYITSDKICAGFKNGTVVCKGAGGGGLLFPVANRFGFDTFYLRGIMSTAPVDEQHLCNVHGWAAFTLISKHERFIKKVLQAS